MRLCVYLSIDLALVLSDDGYLQMDVSHYHYDFMIANSQSERLHFMI